MAQYCGHDFVESGLKEKNEGNGMEKAEEPRVKEYLPERSERRLRSAWSPLGVDTSSSSSSESCEPDTDT